MPKMHDPSFVRKALQTALRKAITDSPDLQAMLVPGQRVTVENDRVLLNLTDGTRVDISIWLSRQ